MQSAYPEAFERDMGCTEGEWRRSLPLAIGAHEWQLRANTAAVRLGAGRLQLQWHAQAPRVIALVRLPRLHVSFRFENVDEDARLTFMRRFDLYMQRGGG